MRLSLNQRRSQGAQAPKTPNWNAANDKNHDTKPIVYSVSFRIFRVQQYTRSATAISNNINIDNQGARAPSIQSFAY